jgi:diguanylate cyclase (GGDEF)-like protein
LAFLLQLGKDKVEQRYTLDKLPLTIGRQADNQIVIRDARVSRYHGRIEEVAGQLTLIDLQSTHHTYVNAESIEKRALAHGDLISVGQKIDLLYLEQDDDGLVQQVLERLGQGDGTASQSSYSGYVNRQVDTLMNEMRAKRVDAEVVDRISSEIGRSVRELKCLYEIGQAINSELDIDRVLDLIITHVIRASNAERGFIMLRDGASGKLVPRVARNMENTLDEVERTQFSRSIANRAVTQRQTVVNKDTMLDPAISTRSVVDFNIRSAICSPLIARGQVMGVLYVDAKQSLKEFSDKDTEFFTALANQSSIAIENATLLSNLKAKNAQLDRKVLELEALYAISQSLLKASNLDSVLETILDKSIEVIGSTRGSIMLYADEQDYLTVRVIRGQVNPGTTDRIQLRKGEGIAGKVVETGQGVISNLGYNDPAFKKLTRREQDVRQLLCVPLQGGREIIGVINLINKKDGQEFNDSDLALLTAIASQAAVTIDNSRLYNMAVFDSLTAVHVRRYFDAWLLKEFERAKRYGNELSLIMVDIDHFKKVNDTYGHPAGDAVLKQVAKVLKDTIRESDMVARYGGEEFIIGLTDTPVIGAEQFAERLRKRIEDHEVHCPDGQVLRKTVSLGVCNYRVSVPPGRLDFVAFADRALYTAKNGGRNRYVLHEPSMENEPQVEKTTPFQTGAFRVPAGGPT